MFSGVSCDDTGKMNIRIGDEDGLDTSGYVTNSARVTVTTWDHENETTGFQIDGRLATDILSGYMHLTKKNAGHDWVGTHIFGANTTKLIHGGGVYDGLAKELDRLTLTTTGTPSDFDGGSINIMFQ